MGLRFLTAGESHGKALVGIIEGLPSGVPITIEALQAQAARRKLGFGRGARQNIENDALEILSGVRLGQSMGSPIALLMNNKDWENWHEVMRVAPVPPNENRQGAERAVKVPRPGHADRIGGIKYDHADMRNVLERSSARETAMRVALGSVARLFCEALGIIVASRVVQIGPVQSTQPIEDAIATLNARVDLTALRCDDAQATQLMIEAIKEAQHDGDTLGGCFEVVASGVPLGLGSYVHWDRRLEAEIGRMFLSLNAIKGVEIGTGFEAARHRGSQAHDSYTSAAQEAAPAYTSNRAGGLEGGMTTGQTLVVRAAMKPLATLQKPLPSLHVATNRKAQAHVERSDVCAVPAAAVIGESLLCLTLADAVLQKFGGDALGEIQARLDAWRLGTGTSLGPSSSSLSTKA